MKLVRMLLLVVIAAGIGSAKVKLPAVFGGNMVLQRNAPVPVWGTAEKNERVTVEVCTLTGASRCSQGTALWPVAKAKAQADEKGAWRVQLPAMKAGGPFTVRICGSDTVTFANVMIGEVWLCSGQSNMEFALRKTDHAAEDIAAANLPNIRLFTVKRKIAQEPQTDCSGAWNVCSPEAAENFSSVAFFFAREMQPKLGCAIGLIHSSWGGTPVEAWMPHATLASKPEFSSILDTWDGYYKTYPEKQKAFELVKDSLMKQYDADIARAQREHTPLPRRPVEPRGPGHRDSPSGCFNGMITPIAPYAIRGVLWYQGEANASRAIQYRTLFPAMIADWRTLWGSKDLPFLFVQLPNLIRKGVRSSEGWTMLREAQLATLAVPHTGMAITIDLGDSLDIHPTNKRDVGHRLALWARATVYGEKGFEYSGPLYRSAAQDGSKMRLRFTHTGGGLTIGKGKKSEDELKGFTIAGADSVFYPAAAKIVGSEVVVWSDAVKEPRAVRYGWKDNPTCNLYNGAGLPASTFRTDMIDRPEMTQLDAGE